MPRSQVQRRERNVAALASWLGVAILMTAGSLVFWLYDALPFQDLPEHAGLIALRHRFSHSPFEQRFFVLATHLGPYSLFRFLGDLLVVPLGPLGAVRAIATLPIIATSLALTWARRRLHGDRSTTGAYLGIALSFGLMTLFGFASYLLGIAVLIGSLTLWLELVAAVDQANPSAWRLELGIACLAPVVLLVHGHTFMTFVVLAGVSALSTGQRWKRVLRLRSFAPGLGLAVWVAWRERGSIVPAGSVPLPHASLEAHFQGPIDKLSLLITPTLMTRMGVDVIAGLVVWVVVVAAAIATARSLASANEASLQCANALSPAHARALLTSAAALMTAFLLLPHSIGWFGFVDGRLVPVILFLMIMAIRGPALGPALRAAVESTAPLAALAIVAIALIGGHLFQAEAAGWREVLAIVPADKALLYLPIDPNSSVLTAHPFAHYDKLAMVDHPCVVGDLWFHQGSGVYPTAQNPALRLPATYSASDLRSVDWPKYRLTDWDYVLVRTRPASAGPRVPSALTLEAHRGGWWLFRTQP